MTRLIEVRCQGVALFEEARVDLGDGFGVLTGESGAGKSLCVSALRFVLGGRSEGDLVRRGAEAARVTAVFEPPLDLGELLTGQGIPGHDLLTLTRELRGGRTTCRINGALVSQAVLREVGERLADVTVQGASHRLLRPAEQRRLLDALGGSELEALRADMSRAHAKWLALAAELTAAQEAQRQDARAVELARATLADLDSARLSPGEDTELAVELVRLRHAAGIRAAAAELAAASAGGDEVQGAADMVAAAVVTVEDLGGLDAELTILGEQAAAAVSGLREIALASRRLADAVELDERVLAATEERLDELARIRRRYGCVEAAIEALENARRLCALHDGDASLSQLELQAAAARGAAGASAARLRTARLAAARRLEPLVQDRLRRLEMPEARFRVGLNTTGASDGVNVDGSCLRCTAAGVDEVEFRLAANSGGVPLPLDQGPSGGELSRLALAISAVAGGVAEEPLLILDEVDAGIGGETAARVGDVLSEIGERRQLLAVTHRPEIAARARWHLLVEKHDDGTEVRSLAKMVTGKALITEVARLMSGRPSPAALARAAELLEPTPRQRRRRAG